MDIIFSTELDNIINNTISTISTSVTKEYDQFIVDCFKQCGIELDLTKPEEWVDRIKVYVKDAASGRETLDHWIMDDKLLFTIHRYVYSIDLATYHFKYGYYVEFANPLAKSESMKGELNGFL